MDMINVPSLSSQILQLQTRHRILDDEIALINQSPGFDQLYLQRLKKQKLLLKESIERLKDRLIPDLDAWKQTLLNQAWYFSWPIWAIPKSGLLFDDPDADAKAHRLGGGEYGLFGGITTVSRPNKSLIDFTSRPSLDITYT